MPGKCIPVAQSVFAMLGLPGRADAVPSLMGAMSDETHASISAWKI